MNNIIPAILAHDENTFRERLRLVEAHAPLIQIDVMDGTFVPNSTWCDLSVLQTVETPAQFELHLMVQHPKKIIAEALTIPSIKRLIWHIESKAQHATLIKLCHEQKREAGIAISPHSSLDILETYAADIDEILVLGAEPGFSGQSLDMNMVARVHEIHERWPKVTIGFDVGVKAETIPFLREAGVSRFCAASSIFDAQDPVGTLKQLQEI